MPYYRPTKSDLLSRLPHDAIEKSARLAGVATLYYQLENGGFGVLYHWTEVIRVVDGKIKLDTGGWETQTTKNRMNQYLPAPYVVYQKDFNWYVWNYQTGATVKFEDHMILKVSNEN